jgi:hypothetical protein
MGAMGAEAMAAAVGEGEASMRMALTWHLTSNHFPPVHTLFVDPAMEAIQFAVDEDWDHVIHLPNGVELSVTEIIDELHLWPFVDNADGADWDDVDG